MTPLRGPSLIGVMEGQRDAHLCSYIPEIRVLTEAGESDPSLKKAVATMCQRPATHVVRTGSGRDYEVCGEHGKWAWSREYTTSVQRIGQHCPTCTCGGG